MKNIWENSYQIEDGNHVGEVIVSWIITHGCPEHCDYCISPVQKSELVSEEDHFKLQNKLIATGVTKMRYIGGEPLLVPHLSHLIQDAFDKGLNTRLSTNGIFLTPAKFAEIKNYLNSVAFPFESLNDDLNFKIRHSKGHAELIASRIKMIKDAGDIGILVNTCVHRENIDSLDELGAFLCSEGINHWKLREFASSSGRGAVINKNRFEIPDDEFLAKVESLQRMYPSLKISGRLPSKLSTRLMVSPQGDLYRMIGSEEENVQYGNILRDSINVREIYLRDHCN